MHRYDIAVDLRNAESGWFTVRATLRFGCAAPGESVLLDMVGARFVSAHLNGRPLDATYHSPESGLLVSGLAEQNTLVVQAHFPVSDDGHGMTCRRDDAGDLYAYTHLQPDHARRVFPCFDQPALKAPFTFSVTVPVDWVVLGNPDVPMDVEGAEREPFRDPFLGEAAASATGSSWTASFGPTRPLATYLVALAAGPFVEVRSADDDADAGVRPARGAIWARAALADHVDAPLLARQLAQAVRFYEAEFGLPCPFEPLDLVFVPDFAAGAMENAGCIFVSEDFVFRSEVSGASPAP